MGGKEFFYSVLFSLFPVQKLHLFYYYYSASNADIIAHLHRFALLPFIRQHTINKIPNLSQRRRWRRQTHQPPLQSRALCGGANKGDRWRLRSGKSTEQSHRLCVHCNYLEPGGAATAGLQSLAPVEANSITLSRRFRFRFFRFYIQHKKMIFCFVLFFAHFQEFLWAYDEKKLQFLGP